MQTRILVAVLFLVGFLASAADSAPPPTAEAVLKAAKEKADGKAILVVFHASWCGWCKRFDQFLGSSETKPIIDKYFVVEHLTVLERPGQEKLENPGAEEFMDKLGGKGAGLPFFAMLDAKGDPIVSSRRGELKEKGPNIGHPFQPEEVAWFMTMVKKAAPKITADETTQLEKWLQNQKRQ